MKKEIMINIKNKNILKIKMKKQKYLKEYKI